MIVNQSFSWNYSEYVFFIPTRILSSYIPKEYSKIIFNEYLYLTVFCYAKGLLSNRGAEFSEPYKLDIPTCHKIHVENKKKAEIDLINAAIFFNGKTTVIHYLTSTFEGTPLGGKLTRN